MITRTIGSPRATRYFFNHVARIYRWLTNNPMWISSLREMVRHLPPSAAELQLLDVGCGHGNSAQQFVNYRPDLRILGLDFSLNMLRMAHRATFQIEQIKVAQADITHLPIPDNSIDAITGHSVYYMLADRPAFLQEALRVLRPGGRLILLDPVARRYPLEMLVQVKRLRVALAVMSWHAVSRMHTRFSLEQMAKHLTDAGFVRVLTERAIEGYGVLSRGEKPYGVNTASVERIAQAAALDDTSGKLEIIDAAALPDYGRGRFIFLLVRQSPDKPAWAIQPGETIRWDAALITDPAQQPYLLAFTSLPKAVAFMQPAVTTGWLIGVNKVAKFEKTAAPPWGLNVLVNPPFEAMRTQYTFQGVYLSVDPSSAASRDE